MADRKYASGITVSDLNVWLQQVIVHHGLEVEIALAPSYVTPTQLKCKVRFYDAVKDPQHEHPLKSGQTMLKTTGEGQWAQVMHLCHLVLADYSNDPWNWTVRDRKREQGAKRAPGE
jgi:hypothetical protein